jgi:lipopolysaccharide biosynthesis protein
LTVDQPTPQTARVRVIAYYLPQFHPIPENDQWWGAGFTEWTNVTKARPHFRGHHQPNLPADLGFYDLRVPETRAAQAEMARQYGVEGFCYWHYWFAGERLLQRPFEEVLASGQPNFPFCLGWANETWSAGMWKSGDGKKIIKEQTYPGREDYDRHFDYLLSAFHDPRYLRVDGKPILVIYRPLKIPECRIWLDYLRELADKNGLPGLHLIATLNDDERDWDAKTKGFDAVTVWPLTRLTQQAKPFQPAARLIKSLRKIGADPIAKVLRRAFDASEQIFDYDQIVDLLLDPGRADLPTYQMAIPNWDTTPRYGKRATVLHNSTPQAFGRHLRQVIDWTLKRPANEQIIFLKSWNEWAEGNYVEPDLRFGRRYLETLRSELFR